MEPIQPAKQLEEELYKSGLDESCFRDIPIELLRTIFSKEDTLTADSIKQTCKLFKQTVDNPVVLRCIAAFSKIPIKASDSVEKISKLINLYNKIALHPFYDYDREKLTIKLKDRKDRENEIDTLLAQFDDPERVLKQFFYDKLNIFDYFCSFKGNARSHLCPLGATQRE